MTGQRDQKIADDLGVHRVTVTRWRLYHPVFKATLHQRLQLLEESNRDKLEALQAESLDALLDVVRNPGPEQIKVALAVFRDAVVHRVTRGYVGETDPDAIIDREAKERQDLAKKREYAHLANDVTDAVRETVVEDLLRKASEPPPKDSTT